MMGYEPWYVIAYVAIAIVVFLVCYGTGVAYVADTDALAIAIIMGCTFVPMVSALVAAVWPLALCAAIIYGVVNR